MERNRVFDVQVLKGAVLSALFLIALPAHADGTLSFDSVVDTEFSGAAVYVASESFIHPTGDRLFDQRTFKIPADVLKKATAGFVCVTGESARAGMDTAAQISIPVRMAGRYEKRSLEMLYHEVYRFSPDAARDSAVTVSRLMSDVVNPTGKFKYSMAAATVVVVYRKNDTTVRRVRIFSGLSNPTPGDIYTFSFDRAAERYKPATLYVAGGHGIKGNATGNLMNGITLSGGDDWDGSTGAMWDMDKYNLQRWSFEGIITYKLSIDTILNWIYPELVILEEVRM